MDVMEPTSELFPGLSNNTLLDSNGFYDSGVENKDSLLDLLSQSFPDMLLQPYCHLSSLPLDAPDLQLGIQDYDLQEYDSDDDSVLEEFVSEVQNILSDTKRTNVANSLDLTECLSAITPLSAAEDLFSPVKKLCPDQLDLLMGPLLDGDDEDLRTDPLPACQLRTDPLPASQLESDKQPSEIIQKQEVNTSTRNNVVIKKPTVKVPGGKPAVACIKPLLNLSLTARPTVVSSKPMVSIIKTDKKNIQKPAVASVKPIVKVVKVEDESSDEVDIETVDDDELNGRSGAEVLSAKLADIEMECQAARVKVIPPQYLPKFKPSSLILPVQPEKCHKAVVEQSLPAKNVTPVPCFPPLVKPSPKPKEKEQSPASVVEKIKQSVVTPRSSILIPHQGPPQSRGKAVKQESLKTPNKNTNDASLSPSLYDARTLDHDYCNMGPNEPVNTCVEEQMSYFVTTNDLSIAEESVVASECEVPCVVEVEVSDEVVLDDSKLVETKVECDVPQFVSTPVKEEAVTTTPAVPVAKSERELPLSYRKWHHSQSRSRSPSPYSQSSCKKRGSRRRSSCSPSSVSSQSLYRSRSRSSSQGRKGRSQTHHRRKHSRGQRRHCSRNRRHYTYSRSSSSSQSSLSSRSRSRSSRSRSRSQSGSRSRSRSWDYKRSYTNRNSVGSYAWSQDKGRFDEKTRQIEERRVVYVGRLPDGTTKNDLRHRFDCFGPIQDVSIHFRNSGHNYGFVTFSYKRDAYEAVEHGNDDPNQPKFDLSFGGRRQFCKQRYADLDSQYSNYSAAQRSPPPSNDFDSLLRAAKLKLKKY